MIRTEVVKSKNIRKTLFYKIYNLAAIIILLAVFSLVFNVWKSPAIQEYIDKNYDSFIQPVVLAFALLIFVASMITNSLIKSPKRIGSLEIDEHEIRFLVNDELQEKFEIEKLENIHFEFYSFRMRGNPMGCMNYLTINEKTKLKTFEIVVENTMVKAELGDLFKTINQKIPVKITYAYWLKRILKDRDFQFKSMVK